MKEKVGRFVNKKVKASALTGCSVVRAPALRLKGSGFDSGEGHVL